MSKDFGAVLMGQFIGECTARSVPPVQSRGLEHAALAPRQQHFVF
jgi:hypothetical protein